MELNEYQDLSRKTAQYPEIRVQDDKSGVMVRTDVIYPVLGLVGEAGEVAEKVKKVVRNNGGRISDTKKEEIISELGDVLWYLAALATELHVTLDLVAEFNLRKLASRMERDKIKSEGDNR